MHALTRRRFLEWTGVAATGALLGGCGSVSMNDVLAAPKATGADPVLVVVTLYGGNDGLSAVVPATDPIYQDSRAELAYQPQDVLDLGDGLGLNPGMPRLHGMWQAGRLAVVRGVGYPRPDHSHFRSMAIWQTASPVSPATSGWLGRWLDATGDDPLRALSLEPTAPPFLAGDRTVGSTIRPDGLVLPPAVNGRAYHLLGAPDQADSAAEAKVAGSVGDLFTVAGAVDAALKAPSSGPGLLATQLGAVAALIGAGVPARVYSASLGGFDTHADERGTQQALLAELDTALGGFADRLAGVGRKVVTVVYSEFGRRVRANGSQGTDHGTAGPLFVMGDGVAGGFHGEQPSLADLDDGDLKFTTDFRDVYATLLQDVLSADAGQVLDGWSGRVPLFA